MSPHSQPQHRPLARLAAGLAAGLAGAAALVAVTPALASAADYRHTDRAGDVRSASFQSSGDTIGRPERRERSVDIRTVRVSHTADRVVVKIRTRGPIPTKKFFVGTTLRTPHGSFDAGTYKFFGMSGNELTSEDETIDCAGYRTDVDRARRLTTIVVPTTCIGSPAWVRVGVGASRISGQRIYADDGLRSGPIGNDFRYSPRIARG